MLDLHPGMTVSFATSIELPLLVLRKSRLHVHELVHHVVAQDHHLGVCEHLDTLLRIQVH
jgi:hypothetical protein